VVEAISGVTRGYGELHRQVILCSAWLPPDATPPLNAS
jgi:hypothetical protein